MEKIIKLVRVSSKEAFKKLQKIGDIYCTDLGEAFIVTNLFLKHISGSSKNRTIKDIMKRLSSINLIERISKEGKLVEVRKEPVIEKWEYQKSYKIKLSINKIDFFIVLGKKKNGNIILISVFVNFLE